MKEFKITDRVRLVSTHVAYTRYVHPGTEGTVAMHHKDGALVTFDTGVYLDCDFSALASADTPFTQQQALHLIDKPFGELDRATQLRLVEHRLNGDSTEMFVDGIFKLLAPPSGVGKMTFSMSDKYRAIKPAATKAKNVEELEAQILELKTVLQSIKEIVNGE